MNELLHMGRIATIDDLFHEACMYVSEFAFKFFVKNANTVDHVIDVLKQPRKMGRIEFADVK